MMLIKSILAATVIGLVHGRGLLGKSDDEGFSLLKRGNSAPSWAGTGLSLYISIFESEAACTEGSAPTSTDYDLGYFTESFGACAEFYAGCPSTERWCRKLTRCSEGSIACVVDKGYAWIEEDGETLIGRGGGKSLSRCERSVAKGKESENFDVSGDCFKLDKTTYARATYES